jgi:hypothetical protein
MLVHWEFDGHRGTVMVEVLRCPECGESIGTPRVVPEWIDVTRIVDEFPVYRLGRLSIETSCGHALLPVRHYKILTDSRRRPIG